MNINFFDLLGIDRSVADPAGTAKSLWPNDLVSLTPGFNIGDDALTIVLNLQAGTSFSNFHPGVDPKAALGNGAAGQIAFACDMGIVGAPATAQPFYLRALPDMGIQLNATDPMFPARVFFANDGRGHEVIIERLPVTIFLKSGLASALTNAPVTVGDFDSTAIDSFTYTLNDDSHSAEIRCFVRLQLTVEGDVILEPNVPISFGPCRWMGLPAKAVYDIQILPSPNRRDYLEWTHNDPSTFVSNPPAKGAIGFRSIDVDFTQAPLSDLKSRLQGGAVHIDNLDLVLEDVVVPVGGPGLPIPSHGTFGIRRKITDRGDISQAYSFSGAPVQIPMYHSGQQGASGGSSLTLQIEKFFFQTGDVHATDPADQPQLQFEVELIFQTSTGQKMGPTLGIDDEWTLTAGMVIDPANTPLKLTIADTTVGLVGFRFGVSIGRLARQIPFKDSFELLGDLFIKGPESKGSGSSVFKIVSLTGKPLSVVIKDLGYKLGHFSIDGLQMPDGMQLIFANVVAVIIEELGWVEEPNGTPYFSFSGGVAIGKNGGTPAKPTGDASDKDANGFGIRVRRLRFRLNDDGSQPLFKIDGVFLKLKYGAVDIEGFGYISDFVDSGWAVKEWGFGVKVALSLLAMDFSIAAMFVKGSRRNLADASQEFDYFLAALELGFLPAGPIGLYDIRALVAYNMAPNLDSTYPDGEGMALLAWHKNHDNALKMPASRTLADWLAEKSSDAVGVGCGFSLNGCGSAVHLSVFIFVEKSKADSGILIVGELFLLKNPKAIAFVAIEYDWDKDKFGVMAGVDLNIGDFTSGALPSWLARLASLTGTIYFGNKPWAFAIGQLADQSTWLMAKLDWDIWIVAKVQFGVGLQIVDGGPKGFGIVFTLSAGADWGIGKFILWGTFGLVIGTWKTGSDSSGLEFWIEFGFKINLFWIFSFGAEIKLMITYLGKHPWYVTLHGEIRIDTPWFMPDVTFTLDKTWQEPLPFDTSSLTQTLTSAAALDGTGQNATALLTPGLGGALGDAAFLYSFNQLIGLNGNRIGDTHDVDIPVVSVDSTIVINMAQPLSNDSLIATSTYDGTTDTGVQTVQDLNLRYGLKSVSVRRAPRFGPTAGVWSDLVADSQTTFSVGGTAPETLTFAWDVDSRADGKLAPKRLLVNSVAPYSFATQAPQDDEESARNDPDYPCCDARWLRKSYPRAHVLEFSEISFGSRTPRTEQFSGLNGAWWHWALPSPPTVCPGDPVYTGGHVARIFTRASMIVGSVDLADPAATAGIMVAWDALPGQLVFEAYDGLDLIVEQAQPLQSAGSATLSLSIGASLSRMISRLVLRVEFASDAGSVGNLSPRIMGAIDWPSLAAIRVYSISYTTVSDYENYLGLTQRCKNGNNVGAPGSDATGKLAFLPNHDYEIVLTTAVKVWSKADGPRELTLSEALYFRTKGLPGLNACKNVGDDIRPHVDATYPIRRDIRLYREEPCVLAFENSLSSVLPIDRTPGSGDPPEKVQMFPLELNVDRVVSLSGMKRLTVPSYDWIAAHRVNPYPPVYFVSYPLFSKAVVRYAPSHDPFVLRFEAIQAAFPDCASKTDHASQVLLHDPIDPNGNPGPWEADTGYRATVRQKGGAFTERTRFDAYDLGAFLQQADGGAQAILWSVDGGGNLIAPPAAAGRHYASCGELDWDHLQVQSQIDLRTATAAGIAVSVGDGAAVPQALIATIEHDGGGFALVLRSMDGAGEHELARSAVTVSGRVTLRLVAFDDVLRASVGELTLEATRGGFREGRVALVAQGPAAFAGILVDSLDIYTFDFVTSRYASFTEHLASYDGQLPTATTGSFGPPPAMGATVFAAHASAIGPLMQPSADPQERQRTFDAVIGALGVGLRKAPSAVSLTRVIDPGGTFALLLESSEAISLTRDVTLTVTRHERVWVPGPIIWPVPIGPLGVLSALQISSSLTLPFASQVKQMARPATYRQAPDENFVLQAARFSAGDVNLEHVTTEWLVTDRIARVVDSPSGKLIQLYMPPSNGFPGLLEETLSADDAAKRPELASLLVAAAGTIGIIHGPNGPIVWGHWEDVDVPVPVVCLSNGAENCVVIFSQNAMPMVSGKYILNYVLERDRWQASTASDPEQHYHQEYEMVLTW